MRGLAYRSAGGRYVYGTVLLAAITLLSGLALAVMVFGLVGAVPAAPQVTAIRSHLTTQTLQAGGGWAPTCGPVQLGGSYIEFYNSGSGYAALGSMTISVGGGTFYSHFSMPCNLGPGAQAYVWFDSLGEGNLTASAGDTFSGSATLTGGGPVPFVGQVS